MHSTWQAIIRSRATPWLLLATALGAAAFALLDPRRKASALPRFGQLSARIHARGGDYVRGLELIVSGDAVMGGNLLASATDRMRVMAEECGRVDGCDIELFIRALGAVLEDRRRAIAAARKSGSRGPSPAPTNGGPVGDQAPAAPAAPAAPEMARKASLLRGVDLAEIITLNGPVMRALNDWLTWNRPQLADAYENYLFLREELAPIYEKADLPEALLFAVMAQETGAKVHSYSTAGAAGPLQFMPATALRYGLVRVGGFDLRLDPVASTRASAEYLADQLATFANDLPKALAAYNGGEGRLASLHRQLPGATFWDAKLSDALPTETRNYVPAVLAAAWIFLHASDYGLELPGSEVGTTTIVLKEAVSIGELTICLGPEQNRTGWFRTLRNLNPRLSGTERIEAGERLRMPSLLVPVYVERCAGDSPVLARARELHDAMRDDKDARAD
jgi:membrane-bound lytic murein transglycosylase D